MKNTGIRQLAVFIAVTIVLLATALIDLAVARGNRQPLDPVAIPYVIDGWTGSDELEERPASVRNEVAKFYNPAENNLTWRRYEKEGHPRIRAIIQQATNFENIHDVYTCLSINYAATKRIGVIQLSPTVPAVMVEFLKDNRAYCSLFCYQSQAMSAVYPAETPYEHALLAVIGRVPCRLIELTTPVVSTREDATARLTGFAKALNSCLPPSRGVKISRFPQESAGKIRTQLHSGAGIVP